MPPSYDLEARARREMEEAGFEPAFSRELEEEAERSAATEPRHPAGEDLTALLWCTIDNPEARDLDQAQFAEILPSGEIRLLIAIADVASFVPRGGPMDHRAWVNTTSVYCAGGVFPMLPAKISLARTSLIPDGPRRALVFELRIAAGGEMPPERVFPALIRNHARLSYEETGDFLEGACPLPEAARCEAVGEQILLQEKASQRLGRLRAKMGALTYSKTEARPVRAADGEMTLKIPPRNRARDMVESFMIATNTAAASFLKGRGWPIIDRVVRRPRRWDRIRAIAAERGGHLPEEPDQPALALFVAGQRESNPAGFADLSHILGKMMGPSEYVVEYPDGDQHQHFGLAVDDYSHSTAPNRRYGDLVLQRMIQRCLAGGQVPYKKPELVEIARRCTLMEGKARKLDRLMRKVVAAINLGGRVGETFEAVVTGASWKGTYVRLVGIQAEGRVVENEQSFDVGQRVKVRLLAANPANGFIDFRGV